MGKVFPIDHMFTCYQPKCYEGIERGAPRYDKMKQVRWLKDAIRKTCMREQVLGEFFKVDEMMVCYKGTYCPAR